MRVPPGASRQCKIVQRILLNLREQRRDGIAVVEPGKLDRADDVGLKGGARQPRGSARFSCEGGFAEKSPAPVTLDRRAEMVIVALRHSRPADIERARRQRNFGDTAAVEPLAVEQSEKRRAGKGGVSTSRSRWWPDS